MSRKLLCFLSVLVALSTITPLVHAEDQTVFGPSDFEIGSLHVHFSRHTFHVDDPGNGYIVITKNTPDMEIRGGFLFFNRRFIPLRQFLIGDDIIVYKDRALKSTNRLTVFLRGTPGASVTIEVRGSDSPVPPPEVTFSADPMSITLGDSSTLTWQTTYADIVIIDHDIGEVSASGSEVVTPQETTTYILAAIGPGGSTTVSVTVTVTTFPPTVEIEADPETIHVGESATLSWSSTNAESCVIEPDVGVVELEGWITVTPTETTTYTIAATGPGGTATDSVTVTVTDPAPTVEISADPDTIVEDESATLSWTSTNATSCVIEPDIGTVDPTGSTPVSPTETTTYTITATGSGGTATDSVTVTIVYPPTVTLSAEPVSIEIGGSATLTWSSTNADSATIDQGVGTVPVDGSVIVSPSETTTYTITVTGPGGTATASATVTVTYPPPVPTVSLSANPGTILLGESATLTWTSEHADTCVIEPGIGSVDPSGSTSVSPTETTTYTITATGPGGTATDTATVTVLQPPTVSISADPETILLGEPSTLTWNSTYADTVTIDQGIGSVDLNGSTSVSPTETTTYTITATGPGGTATDTVTVTVLQPPTVSLSAAPDTILLGESSTLTWSSTNAESATIDQGVGSVAVSGSIAVSPTETTTYTITVTGPGGTATASAPVTVTYPVPTASISADPETILLGESSTLSWNSTDADACVIDPDVGSVAVNGSTAVLPTETTTYTITATGPGGTATDTVTVTVLQPPTVNLSADPETVLLGESSTLTWSSIDADSATIDQGIGSVPVNGLITVSPTETTTYTITVTGPGGTASAQALVMVESAVEPQPEGSFGEQYEDLVPPDATIEAYDARRFSVVTGLVRDLDDLPVADVSVTILGHLEYGTAQTDAEGRFSIPVEGGGAITVVYQEDGLLTVQRKVHVPWNDIAIAETIQMTAEDPESTPLTFDGDPGTVVTHRSTEVTDEFGSRSCSMVFTGDNMAYEVDAEGNVIQQLTTITTRATEYTTPESMPAILPPNSAYTYCVELSVDGVQRVSFDKPVVIWVDNFLGFDVGDVVPVGYYDRDRGVWVPEQNGVVVALLDTDSDGVVDALDADGDGQPDDLDVSGSYHDEVAGLDDPLRYAPGATFWRVESNHFSPSDMNWPSGSPGDAVFPNPPREAAADKQYVPQMDCQKSINSFVEERSRVFHEDIPVPGTEFTLHYASNRVSGYQHMISVPVSGPTVPSSLRRIVVRVDVAGRRLEQSLDPLPNQIAEFTWDGLDQLGRPVLRSTIVHVNISFVYDRVYYRSNSNLDRSFAQAGTSPTLIVAREAIDLRRRSDFFIQKAGGLVGEGWTLSSHHQLSLVDLSTLHKGDGTVARNTTMIIDTVAGSGAAGHSGDGGPATEAQINDPSGVSVDGQGNLYIAEYWNHWIRKVDPNGIITTVAGTGTAGYSGDGGPATQAQLNYPWQIVADVAGNLYIADSVNHRIRKVDPNGIITTVAGTGTAGYSGDGGPATQARINRPRGIALDAEGTLYFASSGDHRIRKVDPNGIISTVAGTGTAGYSGDGGPATQARFDTPAHLALDTSGNLYIADPWNGRIRKVDLSGIITTVAGDGDWDFGGDGGPATQAKLAAPHGVAVDTLGNIYIADNYNYRVRKVDPNGIISTVAGTGTAGYSGDGGFPGNARVDEVMGVALDVSGHLYIADSWNAVVRKVSLSSAFIDAMTAGEIPFVEENNPGHIISGAGRHKKTIEVDTGISLYEFDYDEDGRLVFVTDRFGNQTTIERNVSGVPTAIISPDGITTNLIIDANNHLTRITYPDSSYYGFEYTPDALLTAKIEPEGNRFEHVFDSVGRLTDATDGEGGHWNYTRTVHANGDILTEVLTGEGDLTSYLDQTDSLGIYTSTITDATSAETLFNQSSDGLIVNKSLPCGMDLDFQYGVDSEYKFKRVKEMQESTPSSLTKTTLRAKTYADMDSDEIPDLITETVTVNGKATTLANNVLQSQRTVTSPEGRTVTTAYDPATLLTSSISIPGLHDTNYGYDTRGRLTSIITNTRETSFAYNAQGFLESITDPENHTTSYIHDAVGRMTGINRPDSSSVGFTYDQNGNMTVLTNPSTIDHSFGYNAVNRNGSYQTPLSGSYTYIYDKDRRLVQTNFPSGNQINNIYANGRLEQIQTPEGNVDLTYLCSTKIDSITNGTESISYGYDGKLVTSEALGGTLSQTLSYGYNNDFNVTSFTYAGNTESYTYDDDGLLTGAGGFTIGRNAGNGLPESVSGSALNLTRNFSAYGEVDGEDRAVNGSNVTSWGLTRDDNGRITQKTETVDGATSNYVYTYDAMGRLLTVTKDGSLVEEYQYGLNGTRTSETNTLRGIAGRTFDYSDEDCLLTAGTAQYEYDADGFLTTKTDGGDVTTYDYSSRVELLGVTLPDGTSIEYVHDPLGRRIAKVVNGVTTEKYLWQGLTRLLAVYDGSDNLLMRFEYADGRMPVAMTQGGATYYLTYNQVGSLRVVADASGSVVKRVEYDSFGNIITDTNPSFTIPLGFAGGLQDRDTELVRFGYRDYDPDVGRWTAKDPIGFAGGDTDLYGYCLNDPVNLVDPDGLRIPGLGKLIGWGLTRLAKTIGGKIGEKIGEWADFFNPEIGNPQDQQDLERDTDGDGLVDYLDDDDDNDGFPDDEDDDPKKPNDQPDAPC